MHPVLGRIPVELQQHVEVVGDLRDGLGVLGAVVDLERLDRDLGVVDVLGVVDLLHRLDRPRVGRLRQRSKHIRRLVEPAPLLPGGREHVPQRRPEPSAPSPMASTGARIPRRRQSRSRSAHDSVDSRYPSVSATSSFRPSARTPIITSRHSFSCSSRTFRWMPSTHRYTKSMPTDPGLANAFASSCHCAGQPGDRRRGQPGTGTRGTAPTPARSHRGQPVQVQQRQHLGHLRRLARPRRQDRRREPLPLTGVRVDPLVVDPRRGHRHRTAASPLPLAGGTRCGPPAGARPHRRWSANRSM